MNESASDSLTEFRQFNEVKALALARRAVVP